MVAHPIHVAVLDDDPSVRAALGRFLKTAGMTVEAYDTGEKLLESVALNRPDCLLLDFQMPGMSGLDVLKHLDKRQIRIPTIIMTAHDEPGLRSACLNAGAVAYMNKPLNPEHLIKTIDGVSGSSAFSQLCAPVGAVTDAVGAAPSAQAHRSAEPYPSPDTGRTRRKTVP